VTKGIISGTVGLMLSFVGVDPVSGIGRLTMGTLVLRDGLDLTAITLGLFAIAEMFAVYTRGTSIASGIDVQRSREPGYRVLDGFFDVMRNWRLSIQCSLIGAVTGVVPGIGATAAMFFSYGYAKKRSKTPERFGNGAPEGVLGPEAANNAKEGGSLVPTLSFGIPGSSGMALMIGVFLLLGYVPGPEMMRDDLDIVFLIAWVIALSNILASFIGLGMAPLLTKATFVRPEVVVPSLITIAIVGSFVDARLPWVMWLAVAFGVIGYVARSLGYSNAGIILGFVLGPVVGRNLNLSLQTYGISFLLRPVTLVVLSFAAAALALPLVRGRLLRRAERSLADSHTDGRGDNVLEEV
jgi:putative tricarboxylic transport membrane protein